MLDNIKTIIYKLYFTLLHYLRGDFVLSSWIYPIKFSYTNNNFGDDINRPLIKGLTGKSVVIKHSTLLRNCENLLCIGSIVEGFTDKDSIIWGSGAINGLKPLLSKPRKVCAVRGPLTRAYLISQGVECPQIYGDPALLFPLIYIPHMNKKYKLGIVAHYVDYDLPHVKEFREHNPHVKFIKLRGYESWKAVIDDICSCEMIASSSLHGLIFSDAYKIPNVRVSFSSGIEGGDFKYRDYYGGVNRPYVEPLLFCENIDVEQIDMAVALYKPIVYDTAELLRAFPYKLKNKLKNYLITQK